MAGVNFPRRGDVYWVDLDPTVGTEIAKTRPCVVISNDTGNEYSARVIIAAITSGNTTNIYPFEVLAPNGEGGLTKTSKVVLSQIRTVDKSRLRQRLGALTAERMRQIDTAIRLSLDVTCEEKGS
jgi:mRNA interferase MazF